MRTMFSIYHFWIDLLRKRSSFLQASKLEDFPFDVTMLSCKNRGRFPDMAIRINSDRRLFTGGVLIELKDSASYQIASFNSTIPTGAKEITKLIRGENSAIRRQMEAAGDDVFSLPIRDVFYCPDMPYFGIFFAPLIWGYLLTLFACGRPGA